MKERMIRMSDAEHLLGHKHLKFVLDWKKNGGVDGTFSKMLFDELKKDLEAQERISSFGLDLKYFTYLCEFWFVM